VSLLRALGLPEEGAGVPALHALHTGAAYHRLAVISDVVAAYARDAQAGELPYAGLLASTPDGQSPRDVARYHYREALRFNGHLAEAWFNLGRLLQDNDDRHGALVAFNTAASLAPHKDAQPHAALHANAHWHAATILETQGKNDEALARYRQAVALCDSFGVHHARFANLLRRTGHMDEAIVHYERLMTYSHRYFTEFVLPPLAAHAGGAAPAAAVEILYETSRGEPVVFWGNEYVRLPASQARPIAPETLSSMLAPAPAGRVRRLLQRLTGPAKTLPLQRAASIAALEG
jgi:tetratricopeptide (TPR) repeat protein